MGQLKFACGAALALFCAARAGWAQQTAGAVTLPEIDVTVSRLSGTGIIGTATNVITSEQIAQSPSHNLADIIAQQTGVQAEHVLGNALGTRDTVDIRGFGAFASSNVLVLVNGRRYQDFDLQGFDFSTIPLDSIERVEITRGNSGAVLYGDGAVGGVINIVTKKGAATPFTGRVEAAAGSYGYQQALAALRGSQGPWSAALFARSAGEQGYRQNSKAAEDNVVANLGYSHLGWSGYLNVIAGEQRQDLPGALPNASAVFPNTLAQPRQSNTPLDWANQQAFDVTTGFTAPVAAGADLIVDGGIRRKFQQSTYYNYFNNPFFVYDPSTAAPSSYINTGMTTLSLTPRLDAQHRLFGLAGHLLTGVDLYNTQYDSDRYQAPGTPAIHHYNIRQTTAAFYGLDTLTLTPALQVSFGGRIQRNMIKADDSYNASADPNAFFYGTNPQAPSFDSGEWQYAAHAGLDYRVTPWLSLFARAARAFRLPNADERVGAGNPFGLVAPATFDLKTQTSHDVEGGFRTALGPFTLESSVYLMDLNDEVHFIPALQQNVNLDPTRRTGWETSAAYQISDRVRLRGGLAYVHAVFREGPYAGNEIPLVSPWSGHAGLTWDIVPRLLTFDATARFWSARRMDNDQANVQPLIPANATVDVRLGGAVDRFFWSVAVQNVFDVQYFDYAIASGGSPAGIFGPAIPPTIGAYNAYPLPGRTFLVRAGATF